MPKVSDEHRDARRLEILVAAWTCFQRDGLHVTTMRDIIRQSGLSAGAVYSYFPGKEQLILAAIGHSLASLGGLLESVIERHPQNPAVLIRDVTAAVDGFAVREGFDLRRIALLGWAESQRDPRILAAMQEPYRAFRTRLAAVVGRWRHAGTIDAAADPPAVAEALLALVLGHVVQSAILGDGTPGSLASGVAGLSAERVPT